MTPYVLYSGKIRDPVIEFTEGVNTYRVVPIIMHTKEAEELFALLEEKARTGEPLTKEDLVPLTLVPLMGGNMPQPERIRQAFRIMGQADGVSKEDIRNIGTVIYVMADKFLDELEKEGLLEVFYNMELSQMIMEEGSKNTLKRLISKKLERGESIPVIAIALEESEDAIRELIEEMN